MQYPTLTHAPDCEEDLFAVALGLPPGARTRLLEAACADSPELRQRIEALLRAHEEAGDLLEITPPTTTTNPTPSFP